MVYQENLFMPWNIKTDNNMCRAFFGNELLQLGDEVAKNILLKKIAKKLILKVGKEKM
jgi:hypothetical protein